MNEIVTKCPAKINLNLRILDKREDGYHNIQTDYQLIDIYDHLKFKSNKDRNITIESKETYLNDEFNTIYQSAEKLQKLMNENAGVVIEVKKNIPTGSGLGGASSNAASTLVALNKLWRLNLNKHDLIKIASSIGADVPFFVYGKNASGEGIGDKLEEIKTTSKKILVINPNKAANELVDPEILGDPAIYPDEATLSMLFADTADSPKKAQLSTKYFNKFKSN